MLYSTTYSPLLCLFLFFQELQESSLEKKRKGLEAEEKKKPYAKRRKVDTENI